jgi:hypothetical protein
MIDPLGPDGLGDAQREALKLRQELDRRFCDPLDPDYEPENINQAHWWVQPKWVKYLSLIVGMMAGSYWT